MSKHSKSPQKRDDSNGKRSVSLSMVGLIAIVCLALGGLVAHLAGSRSPADKVPDRERPGAQPRPAEAKPKPAPTQPPPRARTPPSGFEPLEETSAGHTFARCRNPGDGAILIWVPGTRGQTGAGMKDGAFIMGSDPSDAYTNELPRHEVVLDGFWLYQCEVTNDQFARFAADLPADLPDEVRAGIEAWAKESRPGKERHPVADPSWEAAAAYAGWAGSRLPTEAQWEWAARGPQGLKYPWGEEWDKKRSCSKENKGDPTFSVGSFPDGASWCGALDLSGNVWEWCADYYADKYEPHRQTNPTGPAEGETRVARGGFWGTEQNVSRTEVRLGLPHDLEGLQVQGGVGFRCAADPGG